MDERERRLARNEMLFRSLNDEVGRVARSHGEDEHLYEFVCECSNLDCDVRLRLTVGAYERARRAPAVFVVAPGHGLPDIEDVVERADGYELVRKHPEAAGFVERRDPRA